MSKPLIDFDLASFDPLAQPAQPVQQQQYGQPARGGGGNSGNLLDFGDFGSQLPSADNHAESRHDDQYDDEDDYDRDQGKSKSSRRNKYDDDEDDHSGDDRRGHRRGDSSGSGMKINLNIARPGEKREPTRKTTDQRVQRSVAGGARATSPLRNDSKGKSSKYGDVSEPSDNEEDRYGKHRYDSKSTRSTRYDDPPRSSSGKYDDSPQRNKYDEPSRSTYDDDDDYGRGGSSSRGGGGGRNKYGDDDDDYNDRYGRGGSGRKMEGFGSSSSGSRSRGRDEWDDIGGYGSGGYGSDWMRPEKWHCYRARAWESYTNEITGMEYAVDKTPENRIIYTLEADGMRVERESDGKTMFYEYTNIAKINHKHGMGDNFLNFLMKDDRMITISTPDTVEIKRKLLEKVKKGAGLKLGNYKSKRGSYSDYY